ncbi:MAG: TIGR03960 family B12-binding radical SAM protein [Planctomycetota bacterium]|nr:TIGR03960 family B12-binding radical SAM protein [Planctomycetota bacterium]
MRNLSEAISRSLLPRVRQPAQYIGLETNARRADFDSAEVTVMLAWPDAYTIGISHLGSQVLYALAGDIDGVACDRTYCPLPDAETVMRTEGIPLFGWESRRAVADFDILGFSLAHEGCLTNVLTMLDLAGIPLRSADRSEGDPLVIAGNAIADSPEPMAPFIDLFCIGDGEEPLASLIELVREGKVSGAGRDDIIARAGRTIPAVYVPRLYRPVCNDDGTLAALEPTLADIPGRISRAHIVRMSDSPAVTAPLVPLSEAVHDRVSIEIMRGCPHSCRFCQAGATRKPVRWRSVDEILDIARRAIDATGYREISLLSLSTSDYPHFGELIDRLNAEFVSRNISISLPSLRVDSQLAVIPKLTSKVRKSGLTIAAEAGSERLRRAIRKNITDDAMLAGVRAAWQAGWRSVKVYFLAGLPGETDVDIDAIFNLCRRLSDTRKEVDGHRGNITAAVSWLVPRPHTPMQWSAMRDAEYFWYVRNRLRDLARRSPVQFKFHRIERSILEAVIARGDRRVSDAIEAAWRNGARFDAWNEYFDYKKWQDAFDQTGIDPAFYAHRERTVDELLPWDHIDSGRSRETLQTERRKMLEGLD